MKMDEFAVALEEVRIARVRMDGFHRQNDRHHHEIEAFLMEDR